MYPPTSAPMVLDDLDPAPARVRPIRPPACAVCGTRPIPWEHLWWVRELREYLCGPCKATLRLWQDFNPGAPAADWLVSVAP